MGIKDTVKSLLTGRSRDEQDSEKESDVSRDESGQPIDPVVKKWLREIEFAKTREKAFRREGEKIVDIYEEEGEEDQFQYNILYSNTETLAPALYSQLPTPVVKRRFNDPDPLAEAGCKVSVRSLKFLLDSGDDDHNDFDDLIQQAVLEALVPGRGLTRWKYVADISNAEPAEQAEEEAHVTEDPGPGTDEQKVAKAAEVKGVGAQARTEDTNENHNPSLGERVTYETVTGEHIPWNRFYHSWAKEWKDVTWCAIEHFMTREECIANFKELGEKIPLNTMSSNATHEDTDKEDKVADSQGAKLAHIYEIWDRDHREVIFVCPSYKNGLLKTVPDPLKLHGFFPWPKPMTFVRRVKSLVPKQLYLFYKQQHEELNTCTFRINKMLRAMKVRGFYDGTLQGLEKLLESTDGTLLPAENVASMQQGQTLDKAIWLMPLEKMIQVLQQLYLAREQIKNVIYEITGISDLLRGQGAASETATAASVKNQWGTLRVQRMQGEVQRYVRDCLRIMAEICFTKMSDDSIAKMTGLQYPTDEQKAQAATMMQQIQQQILGMQAQAQQNPQLAQEAQQSIQQLQPQMQQLQQITQAYSWTQIMDLLRSDLYRRFRVDIQTNSTISVEATEDKQNISEFMNAIAQVMNGLFPMVQEGILPFNAAKQMLLAIVRRFQFGEEIEEELEQMQQPQPQPDGKDKGDQAKAQAIQAKAQADIQTTQAKLQADLKRMQAEQQLAEAEMQIKLTEAKFNMEAQTRKHSLQLQTEQHKGQMQQRQFALELRRMAAQEQVKDADLARAERAAKAKPVNGGKG